MRRTGLDLQSEGLPVKAVSDREVFISFSWFSSLDSVSAVSKERFFTCPIGTSCLLLTAVYVKQKSCTQKTTMEKWTRELSFRYNLTDATGSARPIDGRTKSLVQRASWGAKEAVGRTKYHRSASFQLAFPTKNPWTDKLSQASRIREEASDKTTEA
jgi:hypothetical protein